MMPMKFIIFRFSFFGHIWQASQANVRSFSSPILPSLSSHVGPAAAHGQAVLSYYYFLNARSLPIRWDSLLFALRVSKYFMSISIRAELSNWERRHRHHILLPSQPSRAQAGLLEDSLSFPACDLPVLQRARQTSGTWALMLFKICSDL